MAKNVTEAITMGLDNDAVPENARAVMNGRDRKRKSDIGAEDNIQAEESKSRS